MGHTTLHERGEDERATLHRHLMAFWATKEMDSAVRFKDHPMGGTRTELGIPSPRVYVVWDKPP